MSIKVNGETYPRAKLSDAEFFGLNAAVECVEIVGEDDLVIRNVGIWGGKTCLRLNKCRRFLLENCWMAGMLGPADPDGQGVSILNSSGTIHRIRVYASRAAEDLIGVYGDDGAGGALLIAGVGLYGRGDSDSSTAICLDDGCPPTRVEHTRIVGARVGVQVADGAGHAIDFGPGGFLGCGVDVAVEGYYKRPPARCLITVPDVRRVQVGRNVGRGNTVTAARAG